MTLIMERERKKRRINDDDVIDDDTKMEQFFALIRSAKDIRDQLMGVEPTNKVLSADRDKGKTTSAEQPEDFVGDCGRKNHSERMIGDDNDKVVGSSGVSKEDKSNCKKTPAADEINGCKGGRILLDLNLSL